MSDPLLVKPGEPTRGISEALPASGYPSSPNLRVTDEAPRCWQCRRKLAIYLTRPWSLTCGRCKAVNSRGDAPS